MQWWGALTQQFTEIAARAVKDSGADAAMNLAGAVVKAPLDMAQQVAAGALKKSASGSRKPAAKPAPKASANPRPSLRPLESAHAECPAAARSQASTAMTAFLVGHATHPDWRAALTMAALQVDARCRRTKPAQRGRLDAGLRLLHRPLRRPGRGPADALCAALAGLPGWAAWAWAWPPAAWNTSTNRPWC
jgi:hypothetical protein